MELWQVVLISFGGNATLLLAIAFLGKSLVGNFLAKDLEKFKDDLQLAAVEHQIRFSKLHEKRAEVLAELYSLLVVATWETESFVSPAQWAGEPSKKEKYQRALDATAEYFRFFDRHRIYIPDALCTSLENFAKKLRAPTISSGVYLEFEQTNQATTLEKHRAFRDAWHEVQNDIPPLRSALEREFRKLLGAQEDQEKQVA
jgi:hypothetical protein